MDEIVAVQIFQTLQRLLHNRTNGNFLKAIRKPVVHDVKAGPFEPTIVGADVANTKQTHQGNKKDSVLWDHAKHYSAPGV
jgi:hypothetical protein